MNSKQTLDIDGDLSSVAVRSGREKDSQIIGLSGRIVKNDPVCYERLKSNIKRTYKRV